MGGWDENQGISLLDMELSKCKTDTTNDSGFMLRTKVLLLTLNRK